ncbi:MAG: SHOCT domain-containing protein, partial [Desulfuromonadales bacterium]|nr:SHOCT domain-containing protein [Desulfuromonadales bacterium]NIR34356.1 SHOCT domain-containing protein [Desulfuromonadales bacterium]NIS40416.1 SHOCT domain-containing protein [Desulfuromonadales bacterium]
DAVYALSPSGRYLVARRDSLLRVFSLPVVADPLPELGEEAMNTLLKLRSWRSRGLITPAEYQQRKQRIFKP